eukprot:3117887-Rhodomonas_salina.1
MQSGFKFRRRCHPVTVTVRVTAGGWLLCVRVRRSPGESLPARAERRLLRLINCGEASGSGISTDTSTRERLKALRLPLLPSPPGAIAGNVDSDSASL